MKYKFNTDSKTSKRMAKVHSNSGKDEIILAKKLWHKGIRYRKNYKLLPGKPDIAITKYKVAVFVDGEFWHGYNWPESKKYLHRNKDYWIRIVNIIYKLIKNLKKWDGKFYVFGLKRF